MKLYKTPTVHQSNKKFKWAELVIYVTDFKKFKYNQAVKWLENFDAITIAIPIKRPDWHDDGITWYSYDSETPKAKVWNHLVVQSCKEWVLILEDGEIPHLEKLPVLAPDTGSWIPVLLKDERTNSESQRYQIRLVHNSGEEVFSGKNIPDATRFMTANNIQITSDQLPVQQTKSLHAGFDPQEELSVYPPSPQAYLVLGEHYFKQRQYVHAAAQYRQVLKMEKLLSFDRLAAVNGLASCMAEQYKWSNALVLTEQSLDVEPCQRMPYLIQFRIFQLRKQWKEAYEILNRYYNIIDIQSRANFDKSINAEETLAELGDLALKAGMIQKAVEHFEELYILKKGGVDREFLKRLFVLSAELNDYGKTVFYFEQLFAPYMPDKLSRSALVQLNDCTEFFMKQGWYDYVLKTYERLVEAQPQNNDFRRRLVVALSKTNRMERARELIMQR